MASLRLARGPLTIGEPAPSVEVRLAACEPYRPDLLADGGSEFGLTIRAASVRGLSKRYAGGPRQDDLCLRVHHPSRTLVAAVADGVSGAPRSHLGAALAVRHAASAVIRQLDEQADELDFKQVFAQAAWALVQEHRRESGDPGASVHAAAASLATTLVVAAVCAGQADADDPGDSGPRPAKVQLAALGDSPAFLLADGDYRAVTQEPVPPGELLGGGVEALPSTTTPVCASPRTLPAGSVLMLCTDGLALPLAGGAGEVGRTFACELSTPPDIADFARLLDFSRSTYDDDRTLIAVWRQ